MENEGWVLDHTLSKTKPFYWKIDEEGNISISRKFINMEVVQEIPFADLNKLHDYLNDGNWKALGNNVEKLRLKQEKEGYQFIALGSLFNLDDLEKKQNNKINGVVG